MGFEQSHKAWLEGHLRRRKGERRGRLERGHGHSDQLFAQNVWYKLKGNFDHLHPEFEVMDWRGRPYFADFAYLPGDDVRLLIEIKDFGMHVRDKVRQGHSRECCRETFLTAIGFIVISFSYDDVRERPELCIMLLRMVLSQYEPKSAGVSMQTLEEKEIIRLSYKLSGKIRPIDVEIHLGINHRKAIRLLQSLSAQGWLRPIVRDRGRRVRTYELIRHNWRA